MMENWRYTPRYPVHQHWQGLNGDIANNLFFGGCLKVPDCDYPQFINGCFFVRNNNDWPEWIQGVHYVFSDKPKQGYNHQRDKRKKHGKKHTHIYIYISYIRYPLVISIKWFTPLLRKLWTCLHQNFLWETWQLSSVLSWVLGSGFSAGGAPSVPPSILWCLFTNFDFHPQFSSRSKLVNRTHQLQMDPMKHHETSSSNPDWIPDFIPTPTRCKGQIRWSVCGRMPRRSRFQWMFNCHNWWFP